MHDLLNPAVSYQAESEQQALARYSGFGETLFAELYRHFPSLTGQVRFFRDGELPDVWAVCGTGPSAFAVQLDPDIDVICLWNARLQEEITAWNPEPVAHAMARIRTDYYRLDGAEVLQQWLDLARDDEVVIDPEHINHEAQSNLWRFSPTDEQTPGITVAGIGGFINAILEARRASLGRSAMLFYCWHDAQVRQLRFSLVSQSHGRLPFGRKTRHTEQVEDIAQRLYADWHELPRQIHTPEATRHILPVFVAAIA